MFDLDGVLIQTEELWDEVRAALAAERGARYDDEAQRAMMGMSSLEWSRYMHDELGVPEAPEEISAEVVRRMAARYERAAAAHPARGRRSSGSPRAGRSASRRPPTAR